MLTPTYKAIQKKHTSGGFTLVETLVALSIFVTAVVALISLTGTGVANTNFAQNRMQAMYYAQEGVELVRMMRDSYFIEGNKKFESGITTVKPDMDALALYPGSSTATTIAPLGNCKNGNGNTGSEQGCDIDVKNVVGNNGALGFALECQNIITLNSPVSGSSSPEGDSTCGIYANDANGLSSMSGPDAYTGFYRQIRVSPVHVGDANGNDPHHGLRISVVVYWRQGGALKHVKIDDFLTAWQ